MGWAIYHGGFLVWWRWGNLCVSPTPEAPEPGRRLLDGEGAVLVVEASLHLSIMEKTIHVIGLIKIIMLCNLTFSFS